MAVTVEASGTQTATIGSEHVLRQVAANGVYTFHVDAANMVSGDILELRIKQKILTGGTLRTLMFQQYFGVQHGDDMIKVSIPIGNDLTDADSVVFTLIQTHGTGRSYPWKVLKYA